MDGSDETPFLETYHDDDDDDAEEGKERKEEGEREMRISITNLRAYRLALFSWRLFFSSAASTQVISERKEERRADADVGASLSPSLSSITLLINVD